MSGLNLGSFDPSPGSPLVISFVEMAKQEGLYVAMSWDNWDFVAYEDSEEPVLAVKSIKNRITKDVLARLLGDKTPLKVVLVEGDNPDIDDLRAKRIFLTAARVGVYVRDLGWLSLPSRMVSEDVKDLRFKLSKRWKQHPDGVWRKKCKSCGLWKDESGYYDAHNRTAKDPKRHDCKDCMKLDALVRYRMRRKA